MWSFARMGLKVDLPQVPAYFTTGKSKEGLRACAKITWQIELITVRPEVSKGSGGHSCFDTSA
jgi:hypothetical protein